MSTETDPVFAAAVADKVTQAFALPGCAEQVNDRAGVPKLLAHFRNPDTGTIHHILKQPKSHIVETPQAPTKINEVVSLEVDPQRILIENGGLLRILSHRDTLEIDPEAVAQTKESVMKSDPVRLTDLGKPQEDLDDILNGLLTIGLERPLQARACDLLRSGFFSRRYVELQRVEAGEEARELGASFMIIRAAFIADEGLVSGNVSNILNGRALSTDSIELDLTFEKKQTLHTLDGQIRGKNFNLSIEHDEVIVPFDGDAGFSHLQARSLDLVSHVINTAILVLLR